MKPLRAIAFAALIPLLGSADALARKSHHERERAAAASQEAHFDYYLLSLSWSPSFCTTHPQERDQCGGQGYGFVLHGLWPEYERGMGPQHCASDARPDAATVQRMLEVSPSRGLIAHEWQTHGACSGLAPDAYFAAARRAFDAIRVPRGIVAAASPLRLSARDVAQAFVAANPGLHEDMLAVQCDGMRLAEVRVCLDKDDLSPRRCGAKVAGNCHQGALQIPLAKGRR
jgi:ribonuclease T2